MKFLDKLCNWLHIYPKQRVALQLVTHERGMLLVMLNDGWQIAQEEEKTNMQVGWVYMEKMKRVKPKV